jgi:hypothetical protein
MQIDVRCDNSPQGFYAAFPRQVAWAVLVQVASLERSRQLLDSVGVGTPRVGRWSKWLRQKIGFACGQAMLSPRSVKKPCFVESGEKAA